MTALHTISRAACVAVLLFAALTASAQARTYDIPSALGSELDTVGQKTPLAILLPQSLALDFDGTTYASGYGRKRSYGLSLAGAPGCGGATACFLVSFTARLGATPSYVRQVRLRGGRIGYFKPLSCGASCSPPAIEWRSRGTLYAIQANVPDSTDAGQRRRLVRAANDAIGAGPR